MNTTMLDLLLSILILTGATFTARGIVGFDDTHASDLVIAAINFGSDKAVVAGTLTVTWDASDGVFSISV